MRKLKILLSILFVAVIFFSCDKANMNDNPDKMISSLDDIEYCGSEVWTLWAGQTIDAGILTVANDSVNIYVTYYTTGSFGTLHLWAGIDSTLYPQNSQGTPVPGQFPYSYDATGLNEYTFTIPLIDIEFFNECGDEIFVVAHAEVLIDGDGNGDEEWETAFGGDIPGPGSRWFYYANYTVECCDDPSPPTPDYEELGTAFAKGNWVFASDTNSNPEDLPSLDLTDSRWGWAININEIGSYEYELWVGAGLNDISKGILVGNVNVDFNDSQVTVTYNLSETYLIGEAQVYASDFTPTTIAPGLYGNIYEFDDLQTTFTDTYDVNDTDGDGIWIIAHAVAFSEVTE